MALPYVAAYCTANGDRIAGKRTGSKYGQPGRSCDGGGQGGRPRPFYGAGRERRKHGNVSDGVRTYPCPSRFRPGLCHSVANRSQPVPRWAGRETFRSLPALRVWKAAMLRNGKPDRNGLSVTISDSERENGAIYP